MRQNAALCSNRFSVASQNVYCLERRVSRQKRQKYLQELLTIVEHER